MKMVKTLLLGSAAGLIAVTGAQAADMPVKGAAVQYVRICNLYGDGFYYLPGTNICVKIGGYVRAEAGYLNGSSMTSGPFEAGSANSATPTGMLFTDRLDGNDFNMRSRAYISMDTREQTDYGILRTYLNIGLNFDFGQPGSGTIFSGNRAFIQFAGFTVGLAQSFFDFYSIPISQYNGYTPASDTGDGGWKVAAFTVLYGNGITSTVSLEEPRRAAIISTNTGSQPAVGGAAPGSAAAVAPFDPFVIGASANLDCSALSTAGCNDYIKIRFPDLVTNWRIDQSWGSAQIMFAAHDASAAYYTGSGAGVALDTGTLPITCFPATMTAGVPAGAQVCGHPADKLGWAAGIGSKHNISGKTGYFDGDYFQWQLTYSKGAARYVANTGPNVGPYGYFDGGTLGWGAFTDGVVSSLTGGVDLTTVWGLNVAYDHLWTKSLRTSLYGSYMAVRYDAQASASICLIQNSTGATSLNSPFGKNAGTLTGITNCDNNWAVWFIGSRTQYNFTPFFYVGAEVTYGYLKTAEGGVAAYTAAAGTQKPSGIYSITDQHNTAFRVRLHRDILP